MRDSFGLVSSKSISVIIPQWWKIDRWTLDTLQCLSFQSPFNYFFGRYSAIRMKNVVINLLLIRCLLGWTKLILLHLSPFQIFLDKVQASFWCHYRQAAHCTDITNISYLRYLPSFFTNRTMIMYSYRQAFTSWIKCRDEELSWVKMITCSLDLREEPFSTLHEVS